MRVCLFIEGSYPYITGGVSAWVHDLIQNLEDIEFSLFTISPAAGQPLRYQLPDNVIEHTDIVLSEKPARVKKTVKKRSLFSRIQAFHGVSEQGGVPDITALLSLMPEGYDISRDATAKAKGWEIIEHRNRRSNPFYAFSDYFWAWKSSHELMFRVLAASPPRADVYHAVSTGFAGLAALAAKIRLGKPFFLTEHGLYHKEREMEIRKANFVRGYQRDMWIRLYNAISRHCYRHADMVTTLFERNREYQLSLGADPSVTLVTPNGIDVERFSSIVREQKPGFHVGLVGRVVPIKDIKTFIAAAKILADARDDITVHCIGPTDEDPAYYEECKALVKSLRIEDRFVFTGRQNVLEYYAFLDILALTSVREAQPLVLLEAFAAGVPCVSTRVGNVPEMLEHDEQLLCAPKDAEDLAMKILRLYDNPGIRQKLIRKNSALVKEKHDKADLHKTYRRIYAALAEGTPWRE